MQNDGFWEFAILHEILFPEGEEREVECPFFGRVIGGDEKIERIDRNSRIFKCPDCGEKIKPK